MPVFHLSRGLVLSYETFRKRMDRLLTGACGAAVKGFGTHSLRRGGAQALADAGAPPWVVKLLGRWSSSAYKRYCQTDLRTVLRWVHAMGLDHDALHFDPRRASA